MDPRQAFKSIRQVLNSTSQRWDASACLTMLISTALIAQRYDSIFKAFRDCLLPAPTILYSNSDLTMEELHVAKAKLSDDKTLGPNSIRSELINAAKDLLDKLTRVLAKNDIQLAND
ncbi:hypothetical protein ACTXT7_001610 [Hymenolepis weldensis]